MRSYFPLPRGEREKKSERDGAPLFPSPFRERVRVRDWITPSPLSS